MLKLLPRNKTLLIVHAATGTVITAIMVFSVNPMVFLALTDLALIKIFFYHAFAPLLVPATAYGLWLRCIVLDVELIGAE